MSRFLYLDLEYTGFYSTDPSKCGEILQVAGIAVRNGIVESEFCQFARPLTTHWSIEAERVHKIARNKALASQHPRELAESFINWVKALGGVWCLAGYNCRGDQKYLDKLMCDYLKVNDWKSCIQWQWRDVKERAQDRKKFLPVPDFKLGTLARHYGLTHSAHDALSDARVTYEIDQRLDGITPKKKNTVLLDPVLSEAEKRRKYTTSGYMQVGPRGDVYISEFATATPEILLHVLEELHEIFISGRDEVSTRPKEEKTEGGHAVPIESERAAPLAGADGPVSLPT